MSKKTGTGKGGKVIKGEIVIRMKYRVRKEERREKKTVKRMRRGGQIEEKERYVHTTHTPYDKTSIYK